MVYGIPLILAHLTVNTIVVTHFDAQYRSQELQSKEHRKSA